MAREIKIKYPLYGTLTTFIGIGDKIINPQSEYGQSMFLYVIDRSHYKCREFGTIVTLLCAEDSYTYDPNATRVKFTNLEYPEVRLLDTACNKLAPFSDI